MGFGLDIRSIVYGGTNRVFPSMALRPLETSDSNSKLGLPESICWVLVIAVVLTRTTLLELLREPFAVTVGSAAAPAAPGPATTLLLNLLSALPLFLLLLRDIRSAAPLRQPAANSLLIVSGALAALSTAWASDKFAAIVTASTWLSCGCLASAVARLCHGATARRLVLAIGIAAFAAQCAQGVSYSLIELPSLAESWKTQRLDFFAARGWELDSFAAKQFENKILNGELIGFTSSANTYAAHLMVGLLLCVATFGFTTGDYITNRLKQDFADRSSVVMLRVLVTLVAFLVGITLLVHTSSRTATAAWFLGIVLFEVARQSSPFIARHRRSVLIGAGLAFVSVVTCVVVVGIANDGNLFHPSLTFRWRYWVGAWQMLTDSFLTGVGFSNFGSHYLSVRLPQAAEEVKDPHNLVARFAAELGLPGLILLLLWIGSFFTTATRPISASTTDAPVMSLRLPAFGVALSLLLVVFCAIDFATDPGYVIYELARRLLFAGLMLLVLLAVCARSLHDFTIENTFDQNIRGILFAAAAMLLLVNMMDFSIAEPGTNALAALLFGACIGGRSLTRPSSTLAVWAKPALLALWIIFSAGLLVVTGFAEINARAADAHLRAGEVERAAEAYARATQAMPLNAAYSTQYAQSIALAGSSPDAVRAATDQAIRIDPRSIEALLLRARYEAAQGSTAKAAEFQRRASDINPADTSLRLDLASYLAAAGLRAEAVTQIDKALWYDNQLDPNEPERFSETKRQEIIRLKETLLNR